MTLTRKRIEEAPPAAKRYELPDVHGLVLRVAPSGTKIWAMYVYRASRRQRVTLGPWPDLGITAARRERDRIHALRRKRDDLALATVASVYIRDAASRKRSADLDARLIDRHILPARVEIRGTVQRLGDLEIARIGRDEVFAATDPIRNRGATEQAARVHAVFRSLLAFAVRRGLIATNPATQAGIRQGPPRSRVLTLDELATWWPHLYDERRAASHLAVAFVFATAARISEVTGLERHDVDELSRTWHLPAEKSKNGRPHTIQLSSFARELIDEARRMWPHARYVFPVSADSVRRHCRESAKAAGIRRTTPHDVRRTVATQLAHMEFDRHLIDLILGHVDRSVGGIYDRAPRAEEQRRALEAWADRFREITNGGPRQRIRTANPHPHPHPDKEQSAPAHVARQECRTTTDDRADNPGGDQ